MSANQKYANAAAFRHALEERLRQAGTTKGEAWLSRRRKFMVFDRLLARLLVVAPDRWLLKGAVALDFRLGDRARATMDLDLARQDGEDAATDDLEQVQSTELGDYFTFQIERTNKLADLTQGVAVRYRVRANLDGRLFEHVTLDIGFNNWPHADPDLLTGPDFFQFAGIPPIQVPALPLEQHVAEKLHAYTRDYGGRQSSRVKDLIDLVLISSGATFEAGRLRNAIATTFGARTAQDIPTTLPLSPSNWPTPYRTLADETGLDPDIQVGYESVVAFLDPILNGTTPDHARWDPEQGVWQPTREDPPGSSR